MRDSKKLEVGQAFEVVEVLNDGGYGDTSLFKIGGFTVGYGEGFRAGIDCLPNGSSNSGYSDTYYMTTGDEVKPVGRLIVKKVK